MTYEEALSFIHSVTWKGSRPGLSRITELLRALGNPQDSLRFIHVAGTNGKGSVSAMTEAVLRAAGYRTGLFVSPFIKHFNERICFCGTPIPEEELAAVTEKVKPAAESMADLPTEFELITAIGFEYFRSVHCDVVVLETGMGGRLDSTNVIRDPLLTVITGIALDHMAYLGDTVEKIAAEKAGIIKPGCPMLWGGHHPGARAVITAAAKSADVPFVAAEDIPTRIERADLSGMTLSRCGYGAVHIPLLGLYQAQNLATVLSAVDILRKRGLRIPDEAVRSGLETVRWPGRFEKLCDDPVIISDGGHNPEGVAAAAESIRAYFGSGKVLFLTGVMADKAHAEIVRTLSPLAARVFTLTPDNPRALAASDFAAEFLSCGVPATPYNTVREAVDAAVAAARETHLPLISLGSLYMYAEVTDALSALGLLPV